MKTSERHHLKTNEFAQRVAAVREAWLMHQRTITAVALAALVTVLALGAFFAWRQHRENRAAAALAEAMSVAAAPVAPTPSSAALPGSPPPQLPPAGSFPTEQARAQAAVDKFTAVAANHGSTDAGIAARYQAASLLAELGRHQEAAREYQVVIDQGDGVHGRMARLGLADVQMQMRQYDPAITTLRSFVNEPGDLPVDGLLVQLGRAQALAGRNAEAVQSFRRVIDEFPDSLYAAEARRELETLDMAGATAAR